jgi:hypothetical protein
MTKDYSVVWNSQPVLGNPLTALVSDYWSAKTWINWHKAVVAKYGLDRANEVLVEWWEKAPFASPTIDFRSMDDTFIAYAKKSGFYEALFGGALGLVGKVAVLTNTTVETSKDIVSGAADLVESAGSVGSNLKWYALGALVLILVLKFK